MTRLWMLPEGVEEMLPVDAWALEELRHKLLDHYRAVHYELVVPPLIEYLDELLTGTGSDLEAQTFKLTDPASGRLLGLRADMTLQAARIAARHFADHDVVRLCYLGSVLRTRPDSPGGARTPRQVGCEMFGDPALDADLETLGLMLDTVQLAGVNDIHISLGHAAIYRSVAAGLTLDSADESELFDILQRKSRPDFAAFAEARHLPAAEYQCISTLMDLNGGTEVIDHARQRLTDDADINIALDGLARAVDELRRRRPEVGLHIDLAELRGYRYETGMVFAAFVPGHGREVARGGRYDGVGREFGLARPATGFSADLNELLRLGQKS